VGIHLDMGLARRQFRSSIYEAATPSLGPGYGNWAGSYRPFVSTRFVLSQPTTKIDGSQTAWTAFLLLGLHLSRVARLHHLCQASGAACTDAGHLLLPVRRAVEVVELLGLTPIEF
jgi:hypothetical protein